MKKDTILSEVPKVPEKSSSPSNIRSYFTKEILDQMEGMSKKEMESVLKGMIDSREFIALLKYTDLRTPLLDATLRGTNPNMDPHKISWAQGAMAGLCDIEAYIIDLNRPEEKQEEKEPGLTRPEGIIG